jgi:hypothetical protein
MDEDHIKKEHAEILDMRRRAAILERDAKQLRRTADRKERQLESEKR